MASPSPQPASGERRPAPFRSCRGHDRPDAPASGRGGIAIASLLLLAACHVDVTDRAQAARSDAAREAIAASEGRIECLPPGAAAFAYVCGIDRTETQDGLFLTLRHPDGGFRRLLVTHDGRGVVAADGAEPAQVTPLGADMIEVALGGARYRLPATVRRAEPGSKPS